MYKLVVLFAAVASCSAKPSVVAPLAYSAVLAAPHAVTTTISQQSSSVVHPSPLVYHAAAAPLLHSAPLAYSAPLLAQPAVHLLKKRSLVAPLAYSAVVAPAAVSHQSRIDIHSTPVVSYAAAPVLSTYAAAAPLVHSAPLAYSAALLAQPAVHLLKKRSLAAPLSYSAVVAPAAVSHQSRVDIHSSPVVSYAAAPVVSAYAAVAPLVHSSHLAYSAPLLAQHAVHFLKKRSLAAPLAYSAVVAPAAISHQSRVDIHSTPVVSYAAAPVVSTYAAAAPLVHAAPLAYTAPLVHAAPLAYSGLVLPKAYGVHPY